jgi:hypothetical protein
MGQFWWVMLLHTNVSWLTDGLWCILTYRSVRIAYFPHDGTCNEDAVNSGGGLLKDGCLALAGTISESECVQLITTSPTAMDCLSQVSETVHTSLQFRAAYFYYFCLHFQSLLRQKTGPSNCLYCFVLNDSKINKQLVSYCSRVLIYFMGISR